MNISVGHILLLVLISSCWGLFILFQWVGLHPAWAAILSLFLGHVGIFGLLLLLTWLAQRRERIKPKERDLDQWPGNTKR